MADLEKMGIWRLRELARQTHPEHVDEAARVFVRRILDMEVERRTLYRDERLQGYGATQIAPGYAPGGTDIAREPLAALYDRGIRYHEGHDLARQWIAAARLPPRQLLAALIQARKLHGNGHQGGAGKEWVKKYDDIASDLATYAKALGWPPGVVVVTETRRVKRSVVREVQGRHEESIKPRTKDEDVEISKPLFSNGQAIKDAARAANASLVLQAKAGVL